MLSALATARVVACRGPFARDSDYGKFDAAFSSENVDLAAVDAGDGIMRASVLFPKTQARASVRSPPAGQPDTSAGTKPGRLPRPDVEQ